MVLFRRNKHNISFDKLKSKFYKIIPRYAIYPLIFIVVMNFVIYYGTSFITRGWFHLDASFLMPSCFPFYSKFIYVYLLAYVQWIVGYIIIARESKQICYEVLSAEFIAKFLCMICFLVFPTTMARPQITGDAFSLFLTRLVYQLDSPVNLFPSIHCLESWMCFRGSQKLKKINSWYLIVQFGLTVLVFLSTVFVHQHVWIDVIGGILVVEIGLFLAKKYHTGQKFERIILKILNT